MFTVAPVSLCAFSLDTGRPPWEGLSATGCGNSISPVKDTNWRKWRGEELRPIAPTCRFVKVLIVYDDAFSQVGEVHVVLI
jgi:hypothetical protein